MKLDKKIKHIMTKDVVTVSEYDQLNTFKRHFDSKGIHHLLVENVDGKLVGIISSEDVAKAENYYVENKLLASHIMTLNPEVVQENISIAAANEVFLSQTYRALPVVDKNESLVGILTPYDILQYISD